MGSNQQALFYKGEIDGSMDTHVTGKGSKRHRLRMSSIWRDIAAWRIEGKRDKESWGHRVGREGKQQDVMSHMGCKEEGLR